MNDVVNQLGCFLCCSLDQGFVFDLVGEFINVDVDPVETSQRGLEQPNHIESLACKGPRCRNRLQGLSRDVDLFSEKLAVLTLVNECFSMSYG